jgi:small subunit ribosomal protein S6
MPQDYETLYIVKADLSEEDIDKEIESITTLIESEGASIIELSKWGKKRLAYAMKKQRYGFYVLLRFTAATSVPEKLTRHFRFNENILKGMTVIFDSAAGRVPASEEEPDSSDSSSKEPVKEVAEPVKEVAESDNKETKSEA